ncbi:MAG: hydrolase [Frankiales bacterium]|nr:hydrolase [Frankiales bacterium]
MAARRAVHHDVVTVETPVGPARLHVSAVASPRALVVLGHGAGRGSDTADLLALAEALPRAGAGVVLVDQPWVLAGRRVASPPPTLDTAWRAVLAALAEPPLRAITRATRRTPVVVGGRSAGARVAARTAAETGAAAVLLLAFPLLPPGARRSDEARTAALATRRDELALPVGAGIPVVVAQGERDTFGTPADLAALVDPAGLDVVPVPGADHGMGVARGGPDPLPVVVSAGLRAVAAARGEPAPDTGDAGE